MKALLSCGMVVRLERFDSAGLDLTLIGMLCGPRVFAGAKTLAAVLSPWITVQSSGQDDSYSQELSFQATKPGNPGHVE